MIVSGTDLDALAASHDIIQLGVLADEVRRRHHGLKTTFVRVAILGVESGAPVEVPPSAGEIRISGIPRSVSSAVARVCEVAAASGGVPISAFSLADMESLAAAEGG